MKKALIRVNELQNDTIKKSDKINGSKEYVETQMKLFQEAEEHRYILNDIINKQEHISTRFMQ